jgi:hypothetical protein
VINRSNDIHPCSSSPANKSQRLLTHFSQSRQSNQRRRGNSAPVFCM